MNSPVSTFERNGQQYVVAYSAGNLFAGSTRGDSVWLFSLGGSLNEIVPATEAPEFTATADRIADITNGGTLYGGACSFCHGATGEGGAGGVALTAATNLASVMRQVREGLEAMPPFGAAFTPEQIHDISAFVVEELPH